MWTDEATVHVRAIAPTPPPDLADELEQLYPRTGKRGTIDTPSLWPAPSRFKPPRGATVTPDDLQAAQDHAVEQAAGHTLTPHPHGLSGRVANAHDAGDEQLAQALTAAEMAAIESAGTV